MLTLSLLLEVLELLKLSEPVCAHFPATLDLVLLSFQLSIAKICRSGIRSELLELIQYLPLLEGELMVSRDGETACPWALETLILWHDQVLQ